MIAHNVCLNQRTSSREKKKTQKYVRNKKEKINKNCTDCSISSNRIGVARIP